ncbi:Protein M3 [Steccherinum ochraceum]|uniref:Protein M3 n=1 Tax=Steccherinum ochraceum TaxID=92696 RepID=A0A4R0R9X5_9APHY|nr:Protein M3 [Steccherinum ochraceum]
MSDKKQYLYPDKCPVPATLANAVVLTVTQQPPFNPSTDPALGVSYVAIFIVSYNLIFWVFGAARSLSWDYLPGVPQGDEAELRNLTWKQKPLGSLFSNYILRQEVPPLPSNTHLQVAAAEIQEHMEKQPDLPDVGSVTIGKPVPLARRASRITEVSRHGSVMTVPTTQASIGGPLPSQIGQSVQPSLHADRRLFRSEIVSRALRPVRAAMHPVTIALLLSLPIALVNSLKALFVDISDAGGPVYRGPDGRPPLAFVIDTAELLGNIAVPLALILLGASFARLQIPRPISRLPLTAMISVALAKMVFLPIIGVLMVQGMVRSGMIPHEARVEKFVGMLLSGTPAAVNQLIVASLYAPDGNVDMYSAFFLVQYVIMFFSASALTAVSLLLS